MSDFIHGHKASVRLLSATINACSRFIVNSGKQRFYSSKKACLKKKRRGFANKSRALAVNPGIRFPDVMPKRGGKVIICKYQAFVNCF